MNNYELQKVLQPINLVPITLETLRLMFHKSETDNMDLTLSELASLQYSLKGIVLRVIDDAPNESAGEETEAKKDDDDLNDFIASIKVNNILFAKNSEKRYMFCINIPNESGYSDSEIILTSDENGLFHLSDDDFKKDESIKEVFFVF